MNIDEKVKITGIEIEYIESVMNETIPLNCKIDCDVEIESGIFMNVRVITTEPNTIPQIKEKAIEKARQYIIFDC